LDSVICYLTQAELCQVAEILSHRGIRLSNLPYPLTYT